MAHAKTQVYIYVCPPKMYKKVPFSLEIIARKMWVQLECRRTNLLSVIGLVMAQLPLVFNTIRSGLQGCWRLIWLCLIRLLFLPPLQRKGLLKNKHCHSSPTNDSWLLMKWINGAYICQKQKQNNKKRNKKKTLSFITSGKFFRIKYHFVFRNFVTY